MALAGAQAPSVKALQVAATELRRSARAHKAASAAHRRAAQADMRALERLRVECEAAGIRLVIAQEAQTHDRIEGR